ncbi:zf-TFIIB domain-containing protein [Cohnella faecalis]|uniref:TFIIB-type zinc ribbon-containing protein n=1 Tax=Cohnella faecalis TaxID=2315694 RepID=UPI003615E660
MNCPVCESTRMREVEKDGILIDICPSCKGVWLDRGELEKLMQGVREVRQDYNEWYYDESRNDRRPQQAQPPKQPEPYPSQSYPPSQQPQGYGSQGSHGNYYPKHKKKKSVLDVFGDLFD